MKKIFYAVMILLFVLSAMAGVMLLLDYLTRQHFASKPYWAVCVENQGMVTQEIYLYEDSTYYTEVFGAEYGNFIFSDSGITFYPYHVFNSQRKQTYLFEDTACVNVCVLVSQDSLENLTLYRKTGTGYPL